MLNAATNTIRNATQHHSYHQYDSTNTAAAVHSFNILDYGAIADGSTLNTLALVAAVNAAKAASGRAEVVVPAAAGRREGTLDHTHNHNARYLVVSVYMGGSLAWCFRVCVRACVRACVCLGGSFEFGRHSRTVR